MNDPCGQSAQRTIDLELGIGGIALVVAGVAFAGGHDTTSEVSARVAGVLVDDAKQRILACARSRMPAATLVPVAALAESV